MTRVRAGLAALGITLVVVAGMLFWQEQTPVRLPVGELNINTADVDQWLQLPVVSRNLARHLVDYRDHNGPYGSLDDLLQVRGMESELLDVLRPYLKLEGVSTLTLFDL